MAHSFIFISVLFYLRFILVLFLLHVTIINIYSHNVPYKSKKVFSLPSRNGVCRMYGTVARIRAPTKINPNRIVWYGMLAPLYPSAPDPVQCPRWSPLALATASTESNSNTNNINDLACTLSVSPPPIEWLYFCSLTSASMWSFDDTKIRAFKYSAVGMLTSWSLNTIRSPFDLTSANTKSSFARFNCNLSAALAFIISAVAFIGNLSVQYVWSAQYTRNITGKRTKRMEMEQLNGIYRVQCQLSTSNCIIVGRMLTVVFRSNWCSWLLFIAWKWANRLTIRR